MNEPENTFLTQTSTNETMPRATNEQSRAKQHACLQSQETVPTTETEVHRTEDSHQTDSDPDERESSQVNFCRLFFNSFDNGE